jgi:hypothetical protein
MDHITNDALRAAACDATTPYGAGDLGTPGDANHDCLDAGECWDGAAARAIVTPALGDLYVNEVMPNPTMNPETAAEWFELAAAADSQPEIYRSCRPALFCQCRRTAADRRTGHHRYPAAQRTRADRTAGRTRYPRRGGDQRRD